MKKLALFLLLSALFCISHSQQHLTKIFNKDELKIAGKHLEIALETHPSLIYSAYLIKENFKTPPTYKDAIKLFNLQLSVYEDKKGRFIDSIENEIDNLPLVKLKRARMIDIFEDFEEDIEDDLKSTFTKIEEIKTKLNYDKNHEDYYEYCNLINDYSATYDSKINYESLLAIQTPVVLKPLLTSKDHLDKMNRNEQENYIISVLKRWSFLERVEKSERPNLVNLSQKIYDNDFKVDTKILFALSYNDYMSIKKIDNSFGIQYKGEKVNAAYSFKYKKLFSVLTGLKIRLMDEESSFSWLEVLGGFGLSNLSVDYAEDKSSSLYLDYKDVGTSYDYQLGGIRQYRKYRLENDYENIPTFYFSLNTPLYHWNSKLYFTGGVEVFYFSMNKEDKIYVDEKRLLIDRNVEDSFSSSELHSINNDLAGLHISPNLFLNYEITDYIKLKVGGSLNNLQASFLTGFGF